MIQVANLTVLGGLVHKENLWRGSHEGVGYRVDVVIIVRIAFYLVFILTV
jgi:hypothetical protein